MNEINKLTTDHYAISELGMAKVIPKIAHNGDVDPKIQVDSNEIAETMRELGMSETGIEHTTIIVDSKNRLVNRGTHYPNKLGRLRFRKNEEIKGAKGDIIRLSTKMRGKSVSQESMNRTLTHELVHRAQQERRDPNVTEGHIAIYGLAAVGAAAGNLLARKAGGGKLARKIGGAVGGFMGYQAGYIIAPHERQARRMAGNSKRTAEILSQAVKRQSHG